VTALAAVCAAASVLALFCLAANSRAFPALRGEEPASGPWPKVSVLVPARDEERDLEKAISAHLAVNYPDFEVIVVDDRSSDGTGEILRRLASGSPRLVVIPGQEPPAGWLGKPNALRQAARRAVGEWLLFVDADVVYAPDALRAAVGYARSRRLDCLCLLPRIVTVGFWEGVLMPNLAALLYMGPGFLLNRDSFRLAAAGGGSGNLVSRSAYEAAGGHEALRNSVIDDVRLATLVRRAGRRARAATPLDGGRVRQYRGVREIVEGFTKNAAYALPRPWMMVPAVLFFWLTTFSPFVALIRPRAHPAAAALSAFAIGATLAGRVGVARLTRTPVWSAFFHPLMVAVWGGIGLRSAWRRAVLGRVVWRGRSTPAREAR
jgi:chlorobactene glucosyltransferase